jgi:hypothetical protein
MRSHMKKEDFEQFDTVYKYRGCEEGRGWRLLEQQEIWFASPDSFNDPFDCNFWVRYDLLNETQLFEELRYFVKAEHQLAGSHLIDYYTKEAVISAQNSSNLEAATRVWIERQFEYMGVFCASVERDNILFWSHYAQNHKGYTIGLNRKKLYDLWSNSNGIALGGPIYDSDFLIFMPKDIRGNRAEQENTWLKMVNTKEYLWHYEKELRMIIRADGNRARKFLPGLIDEVVLGCRMEPKDKRRIQHAMALHYPHAAIYQAFIRRDAFALRLERIK